MSATRGRTVLALVATLSLVLSLFAIARPVIANHDDGEPEVTPTTVEFAGGPPDCDIEGATGIRFGDSEDDFAPLEDTEEPLEVTLSDGSTATIEINLSDDGETLTFIVDGGLVAQVQVKGGSGNDQGHDVNIYDYTSFPGGGIAHDDGLATPTGQQISHVDFCLIPVEASIIVYKTDQTGADVAGAEFEVRDGETVVAGPDETGTDGVVCFDDLVLGKQYTVIETDAPDGWLPAHPDHQTVAAVQGTCEDRAGDEPDATFTNTLLGSLLVLKVDDGDPVQPLEGAEFTITGPDGFEETATSDAGGWFCLDGLVFGEEYTVTETAAPEGYVISGTNPQMHVIDDSMTCAERLAAEGGPTADLVFVNAEEEEQGSITITKVVECEQCETLTIGYWFNKAGVHDEHADSLFALSDEYGDGGIWADGELFISAQQARDYVEADISGDSDGQNGLSHRGQLTIQYLAAVLNVRNNGSECDLEARIYTNPDSPFDGWTVEQILAEAQAAFDGTSSYADEDIKDALDDINNSSQAEENPLTCDGESDGTPLEGATFDVFFDTDDSGTWTPEDEKVGELESGADGTDTIGGLALGLYFLVETEAPEGCELLEDAIPVELTENAPDAEVTVPNECEGPSEEELGSLLIAKVDDQGALLGGATFTVDGTPHEDEDGDGLVCVDGLTLGDTVSVVETIAPDGYVGEVGAKDVPITSTDDCATRLAAADPQADADVTFVNVPEEEEGPEGLVEIDKVFCFGEEEDTQFFVLGPLPLPDFEAQGQAEELPDEGCWTEAVTFTISGGDLEDPLEVMTDANGSLEISLPASENAYTITEDLSGESTTFFVEDGEFTAILVLNLVAEEEGGLVKVIKLFCEGDEASVEFIVEGNTNADVPELSGCELGDASFELGEMEITTDDGIALVVVDAGDYSFAETDPTEATHDGTITVVEGEITTIIVINTFVEGEQGEGGGGPGQGQTPREDTAGGNPLPNTATSPSATGSMPAALLALLLLAGLGAAGRAVTAEARRRR